jgi:putative Mn2+ efflux pump MntP
MGFILLIFLALLVSIDGFVIGFMFGLKRIKIPLIVLLLISIFSAFVIFFSMGVGRVLGDVIPSSFIQTLAGILMISVGIYNLFNDLPLYRRSYFIIIALLMNVDSVGYGVQAGLAERPFWFAPLAGILLLFALIFGIIHGHETKNPFVLRYVAALPGLLFICLGMMKLLF